jgi:hypothetical protein
MLQAFSRMRSWEGCTTADFAPLRDVSDLAARQHDDEDPAEQIDDTTDEDTDQNVVRMRSNPLRSRPAPTSSSSAVA